MMFIINLTHITNDTNNTVYISAPLWSMAGYPMESKNAWQSQTVW